MQIDSPLNKENREGERLALLALVACIDPVHGLQRCESEIIDFNRSKSFRDAVSQLKCLLVSLRQPQVRSVRSQDFLIKGAFKLLKKGHRNIARALSYGVQTCLLIMTDPKSDFYNDKEPGLIQSLLRDTEKLAKATQ